MRKKSPLIARSGYTPNLLLDTLMEKLEAKSDAALARTLAVPASTISKVRHKQVAVNSDLLLAAHELTGMSIRELRDLMGDTQVRYWMGGDAKAEPAPLPSFMEVRQRDASHTGRASHA
jgi:hypothetical protein